MKTVTVEIPDGQLELLDLLVSTKLYKDRNEAVQSAIKDLIEYHRKP